MLCNFYLDLQMFADAGSLTNTTQNYVDSYTGQATPFNPPAETLSPTMKTYYDTELLENTRAQLIFQQLGRKQALPAHHGKVVEWRKWNTLPNCDKLTEGVIPTGKKLGMTSLNVELSQYGEYVSISDQLEMHAIDDTILGATEELGAAAGKTFDILVRDVVAANSNALMADVTNNGAYVSTPATRSALISALGTSGNVAYLTPTMVAKAVTLLRKADVPYFSGNKYVCVIHPSVSHDLRVSAEWLDLHKYAQPTEIYNGEIGELYGVRFIESTLAPIVKSGSNPAIYQCLFFGKDAFGVVDPEGAGMETIIKTKDQVGGPLNQFSTVGAKFEMAAKILYPERVLSVECSSSYSAVDEAN